MQFIDVPPGDENDEHLSNQVTVFAALVEAYQIAIPPLQPWQTRPGQIVLPRSWWHFPSPAGTSMNGRCPITWIGNIQLTNLINFAYPILTCSFKYTCMPSGPKKNLSLKLFNPLDLWTGFIDTLNGFVQLGDKKRQLRTAAQQWVTKFFQSPILLFGAWRGFFGFCNYDIS